MDSNYLSLPSGRIIQTDDIIYVGLIKEDRKFGYYNVSFKITWANRITEVFEYTSVEDAQSDREALKQLILDSDNKDQEMICS